MSDHGPYQSRLLNLLVPQYRRLVEKGDRAIRQIKVAASWAAQVVIYPVYLLLQTTRVAFRQLGQAVKSQLPQLQATVEAPDGYDVDTPIGQVLQAALPEELVLTPDLVRSQSPKPNGPQHWVRIVKNTPLVSPKQPDIADRLPEATPLPVDPRGLYKGQVIRGLATELTSKNLVLVTADNQELDIFTVQQQKELQQLIIWQLAKYRRYLRQMATGKRPPTWGKLAASKTTLLPIRLLGQVMAWEQQGTVARAIDLFGESSLVHQPRTEPPQAEPEAIAYLSKLDSFIANLERGQISIIREGSTAIEGKIREIREFTSHTESVTDGKDREKKNIFARIKAAIAYFFGPQAGDRQLSDAENSIEVNQLTGKGSELPIASERSLGQGIKNQVGHDLNYRHLTGDRTEEVTAITEEEVTEGKEGKKPNIFARIGAAIADFLGNKKGDRNLPGRAEEKVQQLTGSFESGDDGSRGLRLTGSETGIGPRAGKSGKNQMGHQGRPDRAVGQPQTGSREGERSSPVEPEDWVTGSDIFGTPPGKGGSRAATAESVISLVGTRANSGQPDQQEPGDNIYIDLTPDWIETAATPSGYVKHPLEKILALLDRGILWLEDRAIGIWKWFRRQ